MDCIFCKIVAGELPSKKIYEDDLVYAFMDINPNVDGHTLIIPKKHYTDYKEIPDELIIHINKVKKELADMLMSKLNKKAISFAVNYGDSQAVKHYHQHLAPNLLIDKGPSMSVDEVYEILTK